MKLSLMAAICMILLAQSVSASYRYCKGTNYSPTTANCAKFNFGSLSSTCIDITNCTTFYDITALPDESIDSHTKAMAQLITNVFENGKAVMGYSYVEALGDGRGYTSGYIGFTTGTNDGLAVINQYTKRKPKNTLTKYISELTRLSNLAVCDKGRNDTSQLTSYPQDWSKAACSDPVFVQTQLDVGHAMYLQPALKYAAIVNVTTNLGKAIFYDTIINHGWQYTEPLINLPRIIQLTGPRGPSESEQAYLYRFLVTRRQLMCCYPDTVWPSAADRVSDLQSLVSNWSLNVNLTNPAKLVVYGVTIKGTEDMSYDTAECSRKPSGWTLPSSQPLPIPDICPSPL